MRSTLGAAQLPAGHRSGTDPAGDRADDQRVEVGEHVPAGLLLATPPGRRALQAQRGAEQMLAESRQERHQRRVLEHARAERVDDRHVAGASDLEQSRDAELRVGLELQRVAEPAVDAPEDHVDRFHLADGAHPHAVLTDGQIAALHERVAERGRQHRVLEGGLVERTGRQHDDPRVLRSLRRDLLQRGAQHAEERRQTVDLRMAIEARQDTRDHGPVLERVAGAGGGLRAVADHRPAALLIASEIDGVAEQLLGTRQPDLIACAQKAVVAEHELGWQQAAAQQLPRTVEVLQDHAEQLRPLDHARLDRLPFAAGDDGRHRIEQPAARGQTGATIGVVGHAVLIEQARRLAAPAQQLVGTKLGERAGQRLPVRPRHAGVVEHLVVAPREGLIWRGCWRHGARHRGTGPGGRGRSCAAAQPERGGNASVLSTDEAAAAAADRPPAVRLSVLDTVIWIEHGTTPSD